MGRVVRCVVVFVFLLSCFVGSAVADSPFEQPAHAVRELVAKRTAVSRTWEMPSGMHVTQFASEPVQWRDGRGEWQPYDFALHAHSGGGWGAAVGETTLSLPGAMGGAGGDPVRVADAEGDWVSADLVRGAASGSVAKDVATYRDIQAGMDVQLQAVGEGLKETVVLHDAGAAAGLDYRITLSDGLGVEADGARGLRVVKHGQVVFEIPAPTMSDAEGAPAPVGRYKLQRVDDQTWTVSTVLDEKWLADKDRAWPVIVDPTVLTPTTLDNAASDDCQWNDYSTSLMGTATSWICGGGLGYGAGNRSQSAQDWSHAEGLMQFNTLTLVQNDAIDSAALKLYRLSDDSNAPTPLSVYRIKSQWSSSPTPSALPTYDSAPVAQFANGPIGATQADLTALVTEWRRYSETGGTAGFANHGVMLGHLAERCPTTCSWTSYAGSNASDPSQRPVLEVNSWPAAAAGNAMISPGEGDLTGKRVKLQARALASSVGTVRFQYVAGSQRTWTDIPLAALKTPTRDAVSSTDIPVSGPTGDRRSDLVVWDLSAMPGGDVDGPVHVRAWLDSAIRGDGGMTEEVNFRLDRRGIDGAPSQPIGPGELNLLSGEFTRSETDASINAFLQDLTLTRTYRSRGVSVRNADMFGSGWEASVEADGGDLPYKGLYDYSEVKDVSVDRQVLDPSSWNWELFFQTFDVEDLQADIETVQDTQAYNYEYAVVEASDGTKMTFTQVTDARGNVTDWSPDDLHPGYSLRRETTGTTGVFRYTLTDPDGNLASFLSEAASSPNARLSTFQQPGSTSSLSYTYEASGTRQRLKTVTAPTPAGRPARSLTFNWSSVGTPAVPRVTSVDFRDGYSTTTTIATYSYDTNARLVQETDPRIAGSARNTRYHYNTDGLLDQITPSGEATWNLAYTRVSGDTGPRLASVSRAHPDGGTATSTISYDVPLSGSGAPYDMSTGATGSWGQVDDLPWDAVAIWPEDTVPDLRSPDYSKATIHYLDLQGLEVNVAQPGGAISTSWHDANGNVIRDLSPQGRAVALAAGASSASVAADRSTLYQWASNGVDLLATREPVTQITLSDGRVVRGRRISTTNYDEDNDGTKPTTGGPFHLPTSQFRAVEPTSGGQFDVHEKVRYYYGPNGGMSGWTAHHATKTIVDPAGRALTSYSILHPSYPIVEETRTPGAPGGGSTPDDQFYQYYGMKPSDNVPLGIQGAGCNTLAGQNTQPGFLCLRSESTLPDASVPRRWYDYNTLGLVTNTWQPRPLTRTGTGYRLTTTAYDSTGQPTTKSYTGGTGTTVPTSTFTYDPSTGEALTASSTNGTITRAYDSNGRLSSYTDAAGTVTTYRYDLRGREVSMTVDGATTTYGYDDRDNLTSVTDPTIGSAITASYDLDDNLAAETLPNGLVGMELYDETGRPSLLSWTKTSGCSSNCTWTRSQILNRDADGRTTAQSTGNTQETLSYDTVGRLTQDDAVRLSDNRCVRRTYAYDGGGAGDSNRTSSSVWTSAPGSACGTGTPTTRTLTYDSADRITSSGWVWDYFGRATTVAGTDSGGIRAIPASYYVNDRVRSLSLDGRTQTYTRDALDRTKTVDSTAGPKPALTSTYRYSNDTDQPTKISISDGSTTRDIEGPSGQIVATDNNGTITYDLRDLQGSIVGVAPANGTPTANTEYDPFGIVTTATPNVIDWTKGLPANGWLGTYQRPTDFGQEAVGAAGPIEMGARVYLPKIGRFLQVDPVDGGSLNPYDYAEQDPTNEIDLSGDIAAHPGGLCLLKNSSSARNICDKKAMRAIHHFGGVRSFLDTVHKLMHVWNKVKVVYNLGKCAVTLYKTGGVDATSCNQF